MDNSVLVCLLTLLIVAVALGVAIFSRNRSRSKNKQEIQLMGVEDASYSCVCDDGYYGADCSCTVECQNGGTCKDGKCVCPAGFGGDDCSQKLCPKPCQNGGTCDTTTGKCKCPAGFGGDDCSQKLCPKPCQNGGTCDTTTGKCKCPAGFGGGDCSQKLCPKPCQNGGTCDTTIGQCKCPAGYGGGDCSQLLCPVGDNGKMCSGHGTCKPLSSFCPDVKDISGDWQKSCLPAPFAKTVVSPQGTCVFSAICTDEANRKVPSSVGLDTSKSYTVTNQSGVLSCSGDGCLPPPLACPVGDAIGNIGGSWKTTCTNAKVNEYGNSCALSASCPDGQGNQQWTSIGFNPYDLSSVTVDNTSGTLSCTGSGCVSITP